VAVRERLLEIRRAAHGHTPLPDASQSFLPVPDIDIPRRAWQ